MRKFILMVPLLALVLPGCAAISALQSGSAFTVTQRDLDGAVSVYSGVLKLATTYRGLGFCATGTVASASNICADRALVGKLVKATKPIDAEIATVQRLISSGQASGLGAAFATLQSSLTNVQTLLNGAKL